MSRTSILNRFLGLISIGSMIGLSWIMYAMNPAGGAAAVKSENAAQSATTVTDPLVISVGGQAVTASEFEQLIAILPPPQQKDLSLPGARRSYVDQFIRLLVLARTAETEKLDRDPRVAAQLRLTRLEVLAAAEQQAILRRTDVSESEVQKFFDQNKSQFSELHLLHISVPMGSAEPGQMDQIRKEMESLRQRARKGEDFKKLAREYSKDSDAAEGGDLGFLGRGHFGEALDNALFKLNPGQVSDVLEAPGGIHVFKVVAERVQSLSDAHDAIVEIIKNQRLQAMLPGLVREMQPMVNEAYFAGTGKEIDLSSMPFQVTVEKDRKMIKKTGSMTIKPPAEKKKDEKK